MFIMKEARKKHGISQDEKLVVKYAVDGGKRQADFAEILKKAWEPLGVEMELVTVPNNEYSKYESGIITKQFRNAGDTIIEGWNLKIQINSTYEEPKQEENEENEENKTQP